MPTTRAAIAAAAQKFDDGLPAATKTSDPSATAAPIRNSRARALLPAMPKPVRSSRLRKIGPASSARSRRDARTNGVGRSASSSPGTTHVHASGSADARAPRAGDDFVDHPAGIAHLPGRPRLAVLLRGGTLGDQRVEHVVDVATTRREDVVHEPLGGVLAQSPGQPGEDLFGRQLVAVTVQVGPHRRSTSTTRPDSRRRASSSATPVSRQTSGSATHSAFQPRPSRSCPTTIPSVSTCGVGADQSGQRVQVLAALGIALVRHRDAADRVGRGRLAQLADLRPLQLVDLVADPGQGAADHRQQCAELRDPIPRGEPRDARVGQSQLGTELGAQLQHRAVRRTPGCPRLHRAGRPAIADVPPTAAEDGVEPRRPTTRP